MGRLFGTDGVRGIANTELSCELAMSIGRAVATVLENQSGYPLKILIGSDTRRSSDMLCASLISGICSVGSDARYLGTVTTPGLAYLTKRLRATAGIMVSASHNPGEYNGIKVFSSDGFKLPDELEERIEALISGNKPFPSPIGDSIGKVEVSVEEDHGEYLEYLRNSISLDLSGLKIAIDCSNGSASRSAPMMFTGSGAQVHILSAEPDGTNINKDCGSTHLEGLSRYVREHALDAGFAFDGDADRCLCVDSEGNEVDGDMIMAMCALDMKKNGTLKHDTVVGTVMTNYGFTEFCRENGINFIATKVGDKFVLEEMVLGDFVLGGEQSGHIIFREYATTGDGMLTALKVLSLMKRTNKPLRELASVMKKYPQEIINVKVSAEGKLRFFTDLSIKEAILSASERLANTGRVLVRPSGTEPFIRVMAEGSDSALISSVVKELAELITAVLK
ncbi:MAG: phosphoglucosamine mutase [Clostridia bacterium]|nr:phosphoglucosamine mutase [Clostridia bacterium]